MPLDRRGFLQLAAGGVVATALTSRFGARMGSRLLTPPRFKAVAFDAFAIFDPRPVSALAETIFPGRGAELSGAWRTRQFEYQWLRALSGRYANFWRTTEDALVFAARQLRLELTKESRERLMQAHLRLGAWPDVAAALAALKEMGLRLAFLSNMTPQLLEAGIANAGLGGLFEHVLSTDRLEVFKPDPRAYQMAIDAFGLAREEIVFVPFAGWDAAGAGWFGYPTYWVNRLGAPAEELGVTADATGPDLSGLAKFAGSAR
jgi:2-haloacid dehalogenase